MYSQKWGPGNRAILVLTLLVLAGSWGVAASGQNPTNSANGAQQELPESADAAKSSPSATPDTTPARVADVSRGSFIIGTEDVLNINVWKEQELSRTLPVRPDGMITLPLVGEIQAKGQTPLQLQETIATELKKYMSDPQVTVMVAEVRSLTFNVVGLVQKPGYYPLTRRMTVLDAIALSGGFQPFAKQKKIYVLRATNGKQVRLAFNYKDVIKGRHPEENIELQPRDTVVVP
jgi:polysaccharide biosynthesis/export protein